MRKALIVGIDHYSNFDNLSGCVNDAYAVKAALERHADGTLNFDPQLLLGTGVDGIATRSALKEGARQLFEDDAEIALFYFAGHGFIDETGGFLCASDNQADDDGLPLADLMTFANRSNAKNKILILDSCHSGNAGDHSLMRGLAEINEGTTILTASTASQYAMETPGGGAGVFTTLLVDALNGAAANLVGDITPGSVYAHIDQSLGPWAQRPVFKTNVKTFVSLRKAEPPISLEDLKALVMLFPSAADDHPLDPTYEPERSAGSDEGSEMPAPNPVNTAKFRTLQNLARVNLVRPVGAPHMWHAAMNSKACELTALGQHYWLLVKEKRI